MSAREEKFEPSEEEFADFVPAVFARSVEEAEVYRELLNDHDIPAIVGIDEDLKAADAPKAPRRRGMTHGVPVLVPEALLDEASEVIADREDADEFADTEDEVEEEEEEEFEELKPLSPDGEESEEDEEGDDDEVEDVFDDEEDEDDLLEDEEDEGEEDELEDDGDEEEEEESTDEEE